MRRLYLLLIVLAVLLFLVVSALLARAFNAESDERAAIGGLVRAEAGGDPAAVAARVHGCARASGCRARLATFVPRLRRPGRLQILSLQSSTGFSLTSTTGVARVAWNTTSQLHPVVQCLEVQRRGNVIAGLEVRLLAVSAPIRGGADCPRSVS